MRNNLRYTNEGKLVYNCAGVGVVMDRRNNTQQFFRGHKEDIQCLAVNHTGTYAATGEVGAHPRLCVWDTTTMVQTFIAEAPMT